MPHGDERIDRVVHSWKSYTGHHIPHVRKSSVWEKESFDHIVRSSLELIIQSGFAEYYDPTTGEPCGGGRFLRRA